MVARLLTRLFEKASSGYRNACATLIPGESGLAKGEGPLIDAYEAGIKPTMETQVEGSTNCDR
jgi:hypothetical protein